MSSALFDRYAGYPQGFPSTMENDGGRLISSPQVIDTVRDFFGCPDLMGAEFEDQGGPATAGAHWETRFFDVRTPMHACSRGQ